MKQQKKNSAKPRRHAHDTPETQARHNKRPGRPVRPEKKLEEKAPQIATPVNAAPERLSWEMAMEKFRGDKQVALKEFWASNRLPDKAPQILRSENPEGPADSTFGLFWHPIKRVLEPRRQGDDRGYISPAHRAIYDRLGVQLNKEHLLRVRKAMVALHLRSSEGVHFLILQVKPESPNTWREIDRLVEWLVREMPEIQGCYVAEGRENPFHFGDARGIKLKKMFGPDTLHEQLGVGRFFYHPLDGLDADRALVGATVDVAMQMLKPNAEGSVFVLSMGCPALTLGLAKEAKSVILADASTVARETYARNRERHGWKKVRFNQFSVDKDWAHLPACQGVLCGWGKPLTMEQIDALVNTGADRIVRRFRSPEELCREWGKWRRQGWVMYRIKILDFNPLRPDSMELWTLFQKDHRGILQVTKNAKKDKFRAEYYEERSKNAEFYGDRPRRGPRSEAAEAPRRGPSAGGNFPRFVQK